jgi:hypothetical protein
VDLLDQLLGGEHTEIPPDGHLRDAQPVRERGDGGGP